MFTLADLVLCCIISGAIGFFWGIYRTGKIYVSNKINMREFWEQAERWRSRQEKP